MSDRHVAALIMAAVLLPIAWVSLRAAWLAPRRGWIRVKGQRLERGALFRVAIGAHVALAVVCLLGVAAMAVVAVVGPR